MLLLFITQLFIETNNKIKKEKKTAQEIKDLKKIKNKEYKDKNKEEIRTSNEEYYYQTVCSSYL